jgi:hypothetical protein
MTKNILSTLAITFTLFIFSDKSFAQDSRDAGGSSNGDISRPCPISFKRNNGNGFGVCGGDSQIRVAFGELPDVTPQLVAIYYTNTTTGIQTNVTNVLLPVDGDIISKTQPYISYCLTGSLPAPGNSQGNIPPAVKLVLEFRYPNGQICKTDVAE